MADFFLDHGAYGTGSNRLGLDAPTTFGVPQEGDGTATGASTASGVAEILINAIPTGSETIVIAGATITAAVSAGTNQFARGATVALTATNIVTLINSANFTATVGSSVANGTGIGPTANQGRNLLYAQVKSGHTDTVQVMWRIGSTALDYTNNANVAITSSGWGTPPTITQFTGGVSGCFGWFINPAAMGQNSSITTMQYGLMMSKPTVVKSGASSTYALGYTDVVWLRSGAGQTVSITLTGTLARVSSSNDVRLLLDSNIKWTGDSGTGTFTLAMTPPNGGGTTNFSLATGQKVSFDCVLAQALKFRQVSTNVNSLNLNNNGASFLDFGQMLFEEDSAVPSATSFIPLGMMTPTQSINLTCRQTYFSFMKSASVGRSLGTISPANGTVAAELNGITVTQNYSGSSNPTAGMLIATTNTTNSAVVRVNGGTITGLGSYLQQVFSGSLPSSSTKNIILTAESVKGSNIPATGLAPWMAWVAGQEQDLTSLYYSTAETGRSWRYECASGAADWLSNASPAYPLLNGRMADATQYSVHALWTQSGTGQDPARGFKLPKMSQLSRGTTGSKTYLLEMMIPTAITLDRYNFEVVIRYVDNSGNVVTEVKTGADVVSSASSWTNAGSYPSSDARKLTFTTAANVAQYCEVTTQIRIKGNSPTGSAADLYFDPGFALS